MRDGRRVDELVLEVRKQAGRDVSLRLQAEMLKTWAGELERRTGTFF